MSRVLAVLRGCWCTCTPCRKNNHCGSFACNGGKP